MTLVIVAAWFLFSEAMMVSELMRLRELNVSSFRLELNALANALIVVDWRPRRPRTLLHSLPARSDFLAKLLD